MKAIERR